MLQDYSQFIVLFSTHQWAMALKFSTHSATDTAILSSVVMRSPLVIKKMYYGLYIGVDTPSLQMVLTGSNFKLGDSTAKDNICSLLVNFTVAANNSFNISNSSFMGKISLDIHYPESNEITELNAFNFTTVLIEDSHLVNLTPTSSLQTRTVSWISLRNTTITNKKGTSVLINNWNVVFENCTFRENAKSAIIDISFSKQHNYYNFSRM